MDNITRGIEVFWICSRFRCEVRIVTAENQRNAELPSLLSVTIGGGAVQTHYLPPPGLSDRGCYSLAQPLVDRHME